MYTSASGQRQYSPRSECEAESVDDTEVCLEKEVVYGVTVSLVIALLASLLVNCILVFWTKRAAISSADTDTINSEESESSIEEAQVKNTTENP